MFIVTRHSMNKRYGSGFTLVELLIAIAIVSILLSIAVVSYNSFIMQSRRIDASHLLMLNAHRLQRCFTLEGAYNGSCITRNESKDGHYTLSSDSQFTANTFNLIAEPAVGSSQQKDSGCRTFSYDHTGRRTATGNNADSCW